MKWTKRTIVRLASLRMLDVYQKLDAANFELGQKTSEVPAVAMEPCTEYMDGL